MGVSSSEGLAFHATLNETNQHLFLPFQPAGTSGLARRLNPYVHYIACRWDYDATPKEMLAESGQVALVRAPATGRELTAIPADWGPHEEKTGRAADLSPSLLKDLGIETDDVVEVIYPWREANHAGRRHHVPDLYLPAGDRDLSHYLGADARLSGCRSRTR